MDRLRFKFDELAIGESVPFEIASGVVLSSTGFTVMRSIYLRTWLEIERTLQVLPCEFHPLVD